jgi:hypothetical protein
VAIPAPLSNQQSCSIPDLKIKKITKFLLAGTMQAHLALVPLKVEAILEISA